MISTGNKYLIDSCALITPCRCYYPFSFARGFWDQIETGVNEGSILILTKVKDEVLSCEDPLSVWMRKFDKKLFIDHRIPSIIEMYGKILVYIQNEPGYKNPNALDIWAKESSADAWLIAAAQVLGYPLVTTEMARSTINPNFPSKNPKIPDVADHFGVDVMGLFTMMEDLSFVL